MPCELGLGLLGPDHTHTLVQFTALRHDLLSVSHGTFKSTQLSSVITQSAMHEQTFGFPSHQTGRLLSKDIREDGRNQTGSF